VRIIDEEGNLLGVGKTQYSSKEAVTLIGAKKKKPIIHYDYLYLE
jgi:glutamate 5-kinase